MDILIIFLICFNNILEILEKIFDVYLSLKFFCFNYIRCLLNYKDVNVKIRNDLNTINRSFFESLWIEVTEPLKKKLLINVAYCSNVNLSKFFLDEMTSQISNIYSSTDNLILFGDYNINILKETGKQSLNNFIADNRLQYVNTKKQHGQMDKYFLYSTIALFLKIKSLKQI